MNDENTKEKTKFCCISHEFFQVASENPNKIAAIHALGVAQVSRELRQNSALSSASPKFNEDIVKILEERVESQAPPMYSGDRCFTYSDLLRAVHSLSSRLQSILLGADDPHLIRPGAQGSLFVLSFYLRPRYCF